MTRKERLEDLAEMGITGAAADVVLKAEALSRHFARVQMAVDSAFRWVGMKALDETHRMALAWAACILDSSGARGICGSGINGSTQRFPAFSNCGSGRKYANDGPAWDAAIAQAASEISTGKDIHLSADYGGLVVVVDGVNYPFPNEKDEFYTEFVGALAMRVIMVKTDINRDALNGFPVEGGEATHWSYIYNRIKTVDEK